MKLKFNGNFKEELMELGNSVLFQYLRLDDSKDLIEFESLWYEEGKTLNMTLDLSEIELPVEGAEKITVMYSDLSQNVIGEAFVLTDFILCNKKRDNDMTRDLNHITVFFPKTAVANIETIIINEDAKFLESTAGLVGVNTFLAWEGEFNDSDYITVDSYNRYLRNKISLNNSKPLYLDRNGEKVTSISEYKHYKKIEIEVENLVSQVLENKKRYTINNGGLVNITGKVVYDLYSANNGAYNLIEADLEGDLSTAILVQVDPVTGKIMDAISETCKVNQGDKTIEFNSDKDTETNDFAAVLNFVPEMDDPELGYKRGQSASLKSNVIEFITYLRWNVEYSSSLVHTDGKIVMLFDYPENSGIWDPIGGTKRTATITLFSESKIKPSTDISISTGSDETDAILNRYFTFTLPEDGKDIYDAANRRYIYPITITTNYSNIDSPEWYPLDDSDKGAMILSTIKILGSTVNATSEVSFYCIQRPYYPLVPVMGSQASWSEIAGGEVVFSDAIGPRDIGNIYITNPVEEYTKWEAEVSDLDGDVVVSSKNSEVVDMNSSAVISLDSSITAKSRVPSSSEKLYLGSVKFHRRDLSGASDPTNWKDLIYCHPDNDTELKFYVQAKLRSEYWSILADPGRENYPDVKGAPTKYYYKNDTSNYMLFLFNGGDTKSFVIQHKGQKLSITYEDEALWNKYFQLSTGTSGDSTTVSVRCSGFQTNDPTSTWYPKASSGTPLWVKFSAGSYSETMYFILKPSLGDLRMFIHDGEYYTLSNLEYTDEKNRILDSGVTKHRQVVYVTSSVVAGEFSHWTIVSKDSEISVRTTDQSIGQSFNNSGTVLSSNTDTWSQNSPWTTLDTATLPYGPDDIKFEDLVICRTVSDNNYSSYADTYDDWRNQLCEDSILSLPIKLKSNVKSDSLQIFTLKKNTTTLEQIGTEENPYLDLDYIGLYKIFVKSESGFRIKLNSTYQRDNFYFYDPTTDEIKSEVMTLDEGSFDYVNGREVCFVFLGGERGNFDSLEQVFETNLQITSLDDKSTVNIPIRRKYFNSQATNGTLRNQVIDSNITKLDRFNIGSYNSDDSRIFLSFGQGGTIPTRFKSNIETVFGFTDYQTEDWSAGLKVTTTTSPLSKFRYSDYQQLATCTRNNRTTTFTSRGYIETTGTFRYTYNEGQDTASKQMYPIRPAGYIGVYYPGQLRTATNESIGTTVYMLAPAPKLSLSVENDVRLPYGNGKSAVIYVQAENGIYDIYYKSKSAEDYTKVTFTNETSRFASFRVLDDKGREQVLVERTNTANDDPTNNRHGWRITTLNQYTDSDSDNLLFGGLRFETYVPYNKFIASRTGEAIVDETLYPQEVVNKIVTPTRKELSLVRLSKKNSNNSIEGGNIETPIDRRGESRSYVINLIDDELTVNTETYRSEWTSFISSLKYTEDTRKLDAVFKSRLARESGISGGYVGPLRYQNVSGKFVINSTSYNTLKNMNAIASPALRSDFSVQVDTARLSTDGVTQEPWEYGIMVDGYIFVGEVNYSSYLTNYYSHTGYNAQNYICQVKLSRSSSEDIQVMVDTTLNVVSADIKPREGVFNNAIGMNPSQSAAIYTGREYNFNLPENYGSYDQTYTTIIEDGYGNKVTLQHIVQAKDAFKVELYSRLMQNKRDEIDPSSKIERLVFKANGEVEGDVYLITDYGVNGETGYYPYVASNNSTYSNPLREISGINLSCSSYSMSDKISEIRSGEVCYLDGTEYRLYKLNLNSRLSNIVTSVVNNPAHRTPFWRNYTLAINGSSQVTVPAYYGVCYLQLTNLVKSFAEVAENNGKPYYWYEFRDPEEASELEKYTRAGTYLTSNTRPSSSTASSYTFTMNNEIRIVYSELDSSVSRYSADWDKLGYYSAWRIEATKSEWKFSGNIPSLVDKNVCYTLDGENVCEYDDSMNQEIEINGNYHYVSAYTIGTTAKKESNEENSYKTGIVFQLEKNRFTSNGQNYTLKPDIPINVKFYKDEKDGDEGWNDILTFNISMILTLI